MLTSRMPLFYQQDIDESTRLAIWHITEPESFFDVPLQRTITHGHKRLQHLAGRHLLRFLFPQFPHGQIMIADTRRPYLENEDYHFSISHCSDYAAAIVSTSKRVGVDIEVPTTKLLGLAQKFLNPHEQQLINVGDVTNPSENLIEDLTICWGAKEAMYKWWGLGGVDFKTMLRILSIDKKSNSLQTSLHEQDKANELDLGYRLFHKLCLVYTM